MKGNKEPGEIDDCNLIFEFFRKNDNQIEYFGKALAKDTYGKVREIKLKNCMKLMAAKLVKKDNCNNSNEIEVAQDLRGYNIIKINKIITKEYNGEDYYLVIMEKSILRDLGKLTEYYYKTNFLNLINEEPFNQRIGDNFLRFYAKQIIYALETFDKNYFVHLDIKPQNLLNTIFLNINISDLGLITKVKNGDKIKIPGCIQEYITEDYYNKKIISYNAARKQVYFALGSTLFYLKTRKYLLKNQTIEEFILNEGRNISFLDRILNQIKSRQELEQEFIDFFTSLINYTTNERISSFEQIYRNKWLHKNRDELELIIASNERNEEKLIMELQKSDFLINKEKEIKPKQNFRFKKKNHNGII